jgi:hypothetical protein
LVAGVGGAMVDAGATEVMTEKSIDMFGVELEGA